jgi:hypothetical protein
MDTRLSRAHQRTYDAVCGHPKSHNLHWRDVRSLLGAMAQVTEDPSGKIHATRQGRTLILHPRHHGEALAIGELVELHRFLTTADLALQVASGDALHVLIVIDHREARLYRTELRGSVPQSIVPHDPHGAGRFLHDIRDGADGQRRPELRSFYESIAKALQGADKILLFGSGTGASSAMVHLVANLKAHHEYLSDRVCGSVVVDEHHLSENELLAKAREFYASLATELTRADNQTAARPSQP